MFNRFSVKYFVQVKIIVSRPVHDAALDEHEEDGDQDSGAEETQAENEAEPSDENEGVAEIIGGQQEIVLWR